MEDNGDWYPVPKYFPHCVHFPPDDQEQVWQWLGDQGWRTMTDLLVTVNHDWCWVVFRDPRKATLFKLRWGGR